MVTRVIYCPGADRWVPIGAYVRGMKLAKANPDAEFKQGITCWWPCTGSEIMRQFRVGMHERISQARPYSERGIGGEST